MTFAVDAEAAVAAAERLAAQLEHDAPVLRARGGRGRGDRVVLALVDWAHRRDHDYSSRPGLRNGRQALGQLGDQALGPVRRARAARRELASERRPRPRARHRCVAWSASLPSSAAVVRSLRVARPRRDRTRRAATSRRRAPPRRRDAPELASELDAPLVVALLEDRLHEDVEAVEVRLAVADGRRAAELLHGSARGRRRPVARSTSASTTARSRSSRPGPHEHSTRRERVERPVAVPVGERARRRCRAWSTTTARETAARWRRRATMAAQHGRPGSGRPELAREARLFGAQDDEHEQRPDVAADAEGPRERAQRARPSA